MKVLAASFLDSVDAHGLHNLTMHDGVAFTVVNKCTWIKAVIGSGLVLRIRHAVVLTKRYYKILIGKLF
jgi:hypothetical protein